MDLIDEAKHRALEIFKERIKDDSEEHPGKVQVDQSKLE
jgi:hypothetical protein